jgi:hypothetical protein
MARVVNQSRIDTGRQRLAEHRELLEQVGARYGVQPRFILALWAVESDFGRITGNFSVIGALATVAMGLATSVVSRRSLVATLAAGALLLLVFIPEHITLWDKFPSGITHVPVVAGSARLPGREDRRSSQRRLDPLLFRFRRYLMNQLIRRERARRRNHADGHAGNGARETCGSPRRSPSGIKLLSGEPFDQLDLAGVVDRVAGDAEHEIELTRFRERRLPPAGA